MTIRWLEAGTFTLARLGRGRLLYSPTHTHTRASARIDSQPIISESIRDTEIVNRLLLCELLSALICYITTFCLRPTNLEISSKNRKKRPKFQDGG